MANRFFLIALDIIAVSFGMLILHMYLQVFLEAKSIGPAKLSAYFLLGLIQIVLSLYFPNMYLLLFATFSGVMSISFLLFEGPGHYRVFAAIMFCFLAAVTEIAGAGIIASAASAYLEDIHEYGELRIVSSLLSNLLCLAIVRIIAVFIKKKTKSSLARLRELAPLLLFLVFSILLLVARFSYILANQSSISGIFVLEIAALAYMNVIVFWYYERIIRAREIEYEKKVMDIQTGSSLKYYELFQKQQDKLASIQHDIKKHVMVMEGLVGDTHDEQALAYLNNYRKTLTDIGTAVSTPNPVVSVILSECVARAKEIGVEAVLEVYLDSTFNIDPVDITVIMGNTIDNALKALAATRLVEERYLSVLLRQRDGFLIYEIRNSYSPAEDTASATGYGLRNVRASVAKYRGEVICEKVGGIYSITVILQTSK